MGAERKSPEWIRAEYERRRVRHLVIIGSWTVYLLIVLWGRVLPGEHEFLYVFGGAIVFALVGIPNWRCPGCGHFFGRTLSESSCPACHAELGQGGRPRG